jgi:hypothetical protein
VWFEQRLSCLQPLLKQPLDRRHPRLGKEPAGERTEEVNC